MRVPSPRPSGALSVHVLVTGAAGYIGSVLVDVLLRAGHKVRGVDALAHGPAPSLLLVWGEDQFEFVRADVTDADAMGGVVEDVDAVVHLAAIVGDPACAREPELAQAVNVDATRDARRRGADAGVEPVRVRLDVQQLREDGRLLRVRDGGVGAPPRLALRRDEGRDRAATCSTSPATASRPAVSASPRSTASRRGCAST